MALRFNSKDSSGNRSEWKLERGGNLFARKEGSQRWRLLGTGIKNLESAKSFSKRLHKEAIK